MLGDAHTKVALLCTSSTEHTGADLGEFSPKSTHRAGWNKNNPFISKGGKKTPKDRNKSATAQQAGKQHHLQPFAPHEHKSRKKQVTVPKTQSKA